MNRFSSVEFPLAASVRMIGCHIYISNDWKETISAGPLKFSKHDIKCNNKMCISNLIKCWYC